MKVNKVIPTPYYTLVLEAGEQFRLKRNFQVKVIEVHAGHFYLYGGGSGLKMYERGFFSVDEVSSMPPGIAQEVTNRMVELKAES